MSTCTGMSRICRGAVQCSKIITKELLFCSNVQVSQGEAGASMLDTCACQNGVLKATGKYLVQVWMVPQKLVVKGMG